MKSESLSFNSNAHKLLATHKRCEGWVLQRLLLSGDNPTVSRVDKSSTKPPQFPYIKKMNVNGVVDVDVTEEEENDLMLATKTWRDDNYFRFVRPELDSEEAAMEYFCNRSNPFYSKKSVNETLRMQQMGGFIDKNSLLESTEGIRYSVDSKRSSPPRLFVIKKERVDKKDRNNVLNLYYIAGGIVFQSPSLFDVIQSRSYNSLSLLNQTFKEIQPCVEYSANDQTILVEPSLKKQDDESNDNNQIFIQSLPPYSNEMQQHVEKLIDALDGETNLLIQAKQLRLQQAAAAPTEQ